MESNRQPESEDAKLRERLQEFLGHARELESVTEPPAGLPRVTEPVRPQLPLHEQLLPS